MIVYTPPHAATCIPLIDLAGSFADTEARADVTSVMHRTARETEFLTVTGH